MEEHEITVKVIEYRDRKSLLLQYVDPMTGRKKSKSAKTNDRNEAMKAAAVWEAALRNGSYQPPSRTTWADFRQRYETEVGGGLAPNTLDKIIRTFDHVERRLSPQRVRDITAQRLSWFVAELRKETKDGDQIKPGLAETSIQSYLSHLKAALNWAFKNDIIIKAPRFPKLQQAKGDAMKGRAPTGEEFDRMIAVVPKVVGEAYAAEWRRYLRGLWWSGFRITESLTLSWDEGAGLVVDLSGKYPVVHIAAASQKSRKSETLPMAPEFADMLTAVPVEGQTGNVFNPLSPQTHKRANRDMAIRTVSAIGKAAGVKVWTNPKNGDVKHCTAHDLRRAFGSRWASRVMPVVLQQMMRHASITTTLKYYVGKNAQQSAGVIWEAFARQNKPEHPPEKAASEKQSLPTVSHQMLGD